MRKNKKGIIADLAFWASIGMVMTVIALTGYLILSEFNNVIQEIPEADNATVKVPISTYSARYDNVMDSGIALAIIGGHLGIILLGFMLRSHPALWFGLFLFLMMITILTGFMSNAWDEIASDPGLASYSSGFVWSGWILDNYMMFTLFAGFLDLVVFLGTSRFLGGAEG